MHPLCCAGDTPEGAAEAANASSEATTAGETASGTEVALAQAQNVQHEAMLAGEASLNAGRDRLLDVRDAMQQSHQDAHGMQHPFRKQHCIARSWILKGCHSFMYYVVSYDALQSCTSPCFCMHSCLHVIGSHIIFQAKVHVRDQHM